MSTKKKKTKKAIKKVVVDRKFMLDLANRIYNPKTKQFLRLCDGTLQNGPDPTNPKRPMHCGLGELYFAMTGRQPEETGVDENDVCELAVKLSTLKDVEDQIDTTVTNTVKAISKLNLPKEVKNLLIETAQNDIHGETLGLDEDAQDNFWKALDTIPAENDDGCGHSVSVEEDSDKAICTVADFRNRSKRVAAQLRKAASYLP